MRLFGSRCIVLSNFNGSIGPKNQTYSDIIRAGNLKAVPYFKYSVEFKDTLSAGKTPTQFQKIVSKFLKHPTFKIFSGILFKKDYFDSGLDQDLLSKETGVLGDELFFRTYLPFDLMKLHHADALTIGSRIYLSPDKIDLSSDRGKALAVHEITHVEQQKKYPVISENAQTITSSKYSEMEREAQDAERDFLKLSVYSKLNKGKKTPYEEQHLHGTRNIGNIGHFEFEIKESDFDVIDEFSLVHPSTAKALRRMLKEDKLNIATEGVAISGENKEGTSLSNFVDGTSLAMKSVNQVFFASEGRSVYPPAVAPLIEPFADNKQLPSTSKELDLDILAQQVYDLVSKRLIMERSRRGLR
jgi:hypothetical protein